MAAVVGLLHLWLGPVDSWMIKFAVGMPDGFGTVAELIHVPDVREVVDLLASLTGQTATAR